VDERKHSSMLIETVRAEIPVKPKYARNARPGDSVVSLEIGSDWCRAWYYDGNICGDTYNFGPAGVGQLVDVPHFGEVFKYVSEQWSANRSNPLGAFLHPMVTAMETALAEKEGSCVYFAEAAGRVKIGWSRKVASRVAQLQTGNASPVRLLCVIPGGRAQERRLHERFAHARLSGEWFEGTPDLMAYIASVTV
jgi:hypothetical protein